jgi:hypothetical protein
MKVNALQKSNTKVILSYLSLNSSSIKESVWYNTSFLLFTAVVSRDDKVCKYCALNRV